MNRPLQVCLLVLTSLLCFGGGAWYSSSRRAGTMAARTRRVLYYHDPMHPAYRSPKPGTAPDCGMDLEPVYEDSVPVPPDRALPGTIRISHAQQQMIGIRVAVVEGAGASWHSLRLLGKITPDETRVYRLNAAIDGWIRNISIVTTGSLVRQDDVLASFYSPDFLSTQQAYLFSLGALDRFKGTGRETPDQIALTNASIQQNVDALRNLGMGEIQVQEIQRTRALTQNINVYAPIAGCVLARNVSPGQRFEKGTELFRIADLSHVWVVADTFDADARDIRPGTRAVIRHRGAPLYAKVSDVLPQFDPASRSLRFRLEVENPSYQLRPDMFVDVELPVHLPDALTVPADAVVDSGRRTVVYIDCGEGVYEPREVEVGARYGDRVAITRGLADGERVVSGGTFLLDSESRLRLVAAQTPAHAEKDPVCGMTVNSDAHSTRIGERTYWFCSAKCKHNFDANPGKYAKRGE